MIIIIISDNDFLFYSCIGLRFNELKCRDGNLNYIHEKKPSI